MKHQRLLTYATAFGLMLLVLIGYFHPITALTQDLGRHLKTGEIIFNTFSVPQVNLYSYTYPQFPFINHHWGSEVVFFLLHSATGFIGLYSLMLLLISASFLLQVKAVFSRVSPLVLGIVGITYIGVLLERTDLRPELFSFLLLSIFVTLLYQNREKATRLIYLLIPLQLLWINLHIYFAVGLIVIGLFFLDTLIMHRKKLAVSSVYTLGVVLLCSTIVSLINPNGLSGFLYPLNVFSNYGYSIEENQTIFLLMELGFTKPSIPYFFTAVLLLFTSLGIHYKKTKPIDWFLSLVFTYLAFSAVRNFPLFVFTTFIPCSIALTALTQKFSLPKSGKQYAYPLLIFFLLSLILWQGSIILNKHPIGYGVTQGAEKATAFMENEKIRGPIFNNFDIGSYLIYRLYPNQRVFVDGRPEAYPASFFRDIYIPMQQNPTLFADVATQYDFQTIFFSHTDQTPWGNAFLTSIMSDPSWSTVYLDDYVIILLKHSPENEKHITRFGMTRETLRVKNIEQTFEAKLRLISFFTKIGWYDEAIPYLEAALREKPKFCPALQLLTQLYSEKQHPAAMIYVQRYSTTCGSL